MRLRLGLVLPAVRANSTPQNSLAGFEGPIRVQDGKREGKGKGKEKRKERKGTAENAPPPEKKSGYGLGKNKSRMFKLTVSENGRKRRCSVAGTTHAHTVTMREAKLS